MEQDTSLLLNTISKPVQTPVVSEYRKQVKRINLKRKGEGGLKDENVIGSRNSTFKVPQVSTKNKRESKFESSTSDSKVKKFKAVTGGHIISSIFSKNPEIQNVEINPQDVKPNRENLFTSTQFSELPIHSRLVSCLTKMSFITMTEVQRKAVPYLLAGADCLIKSQTGSGKTLCYAVPLLQRLIETTSLKRSDGVKALVLLPTRELALQTMATFNKLVHSCVWIVPGIIIGGDKLSSEKKRLRKGIHILIATPGRLAYHIKNTKCLDVQNIDYFIIDEADRLLDMGFGKQVNEILAAIRSDKERCASRQTVLLSATLSSNIKSLASIALNDPVTIDIAVKDNQSSHKMSIEHSKPITKDEIGTEDVYTVPNGLKQYYVTVPSKLRLVTLASLILAKCQYSTKPHKMMVFLPSQDIVQFYYELFNSTINNVNPYGHNEANVEQPKTGKDGGGSKTRFDMYALHGEMKQEFRAQVYESFKTSSHGVLLCTDVASRGLDLPNVDWVVQYLPPLSPELYIHRVGRTARIGREGSALLFLMPSEVKFIQLLADKNISLTAITMESVLDTCLLEIDRLKPNSTNLSKSGNTTPDKQQAATALQRALDVWTNSDSSHLEKAKQAYQSFARAYSTYPSHLKHIFHVKQLHLGHLGKSFCLHDAPSIMKGVPLTLRQQKKLKYRDLDRQESRKKKKIDMSEYSCGF